MRKKIFILCLLPLLLLSCSNVEPVTKTEKRTIKIHAIDETHKERVDLKVYP